MGTILKYSRTFDRSTARRRDRITITFRLSFISPLVPNINVWFDNLGDNLGGSKETNGPLNYAWTNYISATNLIPLSAEFNTVGDGTSRGCVRSWANGTTYPSPTSPLTEVWKPINPNTYSELVISAEFNVDELAVIGTVIGLPTRVTPTSNTNYDANKMMLDFGSGFTLFISNNGEPGSSTLTIEAGHS